MRTIWLSFPLIVCILGQNIENLADIASTLEILHVVFRHGDRTPTKLYPNDPYTEKTFYPIRIGHLTNKGKMTAFKIGESLRSRYKAFIPEVYTPEIIRAISSHIPRAKATLELVLAGLFPPTDKLSWNDDLAWQPIPYDYAARSKDKLFRPISACPRYTTTYKSSLESYNNPVEDKYHNLLPFLQKSSGLQQDTVISLGMTLYSVLKSEADFGLELPAWTKEVYPKIISELSAQGWVKSLVGHLKILNAGFLVSQIMNNTRLTTQRNPWFKDNKVYLYSGHDINITSLLAFLDNFVAHNPNYGAHIIIEVHNISGTRYLKFSYENYQHDEPVSLKIPKCGVYCPLKTFEDLYTDHLDAYLDALCG